MKPTTQLRQLLARDSLLLAPFVYDAFTARIAEDVGFEAIYMGGFVTSMTYGYPDLGLLTQTEMVANATRIAQRISAPLICDADTGYGNAINVWRTVRLHESAGVAGIHIEDQVDPKRCGFFEGKDVIPLDEAVQKVRAAVDARQDPDFVIIARTDALAVVGWEETVIRCRAFREAGADLIFVDGIRTDNDLHTYAKELADVPRLLNGDQFAAGDVGKLGFKIQIHRGPMFRSYHWYRSQYQELKDTGQLDPADYPDTFELRTKIARLLGKDEIDEMERRYATNQPEGGSS
ncbi:MAG: 2-Methylisocitrate lyase, PEP mutase family [Chloroflexi bacterium]|nr:MAG: 2-Methylisocitrate lyase, PEP mutase family [Chloroflexota bacterium]